MAECPRYKSFPAQTDMRVNRSWTREDAAECGIARDSRRARWMQESPRVCFRINGCIHLYQPRCVRRNRPLKGLPQLVGSRYPGCLHAKSASELYEVRILKIRADDSSAKARQLITAYIAIRPIVK